MSRKPTFALAGAAGYVAPKHLGAIKGVNGTLMYATDPSDSVGVLDGFDMRTEFFTDREPFERALYRYPPDYLVVATPNHLHESYVRLGLTAGCNVICEKPIVLNPGNLDTLENLEEATGKKVYTVLQLRHRIDDLGLRPKYEKGLHTVKVRYATPRGPWYRHSWKADERKSGGIITNIGIHLFDALIYLFGNVTSATDSHRSMYEDGFVDMVAGTVELERANVQWQLSTAASVNPARTFQINDDPPVDLTEGFTEAHTRVYREILDGNGFGIEDARQAVELCWQLRGL